MDPALPKDMHPWPGMWPETCPGATEGSLGQVSVLALYLLTLALVPEVTALGSILGTSSAYMWSLEMVCCPWLTSDLESECQHVQGAEASLD